MPTDTEFVRVRECPDGSHPDGDGVWIATRPSLDCGISARQDLSIAAAESGDDEDAMQRAIIRRWFATYCRLATVSWNLHDENGAWPFDPERLVADFDLGYPVADRADDLYRETVMRPLLATGLPTSPTGRTDGSTSAPTTSTGKPRGRSSRAPMAGLPSPALIE